jgi:hypothetical protein
VALLYIRAVECWSLAGFILSSRVSNVVRVKRCGKVNITIGQERKRRVRMHDGWGDARMIRDTTKSFEHQPRKIEGRRVRRNEI